MTGFAFVCPGTPVPQGSKITGANWAMREANPDLWPWRQAVTWIAKECEPLDDGPVAVKCVFTVRRPMHPKRRTAAPYTRPDLDKLARAILDGITDAQLWEDDGRVAEFVRLAKVWPGMDQDALPWPGVCMAAVSMIGRPETVWLDELDTLYDTTLAAQQSPRAAP